MSYENATFGVPKTAEDGADQPRAAPVAAVQEAGPVAKPAHGGAERAPPRKVSRTRRLVHFARWLAPIFEKELRTAARRRRTYFVRMAYLGALIVVVAVAWNEAAAAMQVGAAQGSLILGGLAPSILITLGWFQLIGLTLVAPALTVNSISEERSRRTLGILLATPMTAMQIATAKLLGCSLQLLLLTALSFPVLAAISVYGGVEPWHVVGVTSLSLANGLFAAAVGLHASTSSVRWGLRLPMAYLELIGWHVVVVMCALPLTMYLLPLINPFVAMAVFSGAVMNPTANLARFVWIPSTLALLAATLLLTRVTGRRLRFLAFPDPDAAEQLGEAVRRPFDANREETRAPNTRDANAPFPSATATPTVQPIGSSHEPASANTSAQPFRVAGQRRSRRVGDDPILWRELTRPVGQGEEGVYSLVLLLLAYALILVYAAGIGTESLHRGAFHGGMMAVYCLLPLIATAARTAPTFTAEKAAACWPVLLSTPLTGAQFLSSKATVVLRRTYRFWLLAAGHAVIFIATGHLHPIFPVHAFLIAGSGLAMVLAVGLFISLCARRTSTALAWTIGILFFLWCVLPWTLVNLLYIHEPDPWMLNPVVLMREAAAGAAGGQWAPLGGPSVELVRFTAMMIAVSTAYAAVAIALFSYMGARFNRIVGRTS